MATTKCAPTRRLLLGMQGGASLMNEITDYSFREWLTLFLRAVPAFLIAAFVWALALSMVLAVLTAVVTASN